MLERSHRPTHSFATSDSQTEKLNQQIFHQLQDEYVQCQKLGHHGLGARGLRSAGFRLVDGTCFWKVGGERQVTVWLDVNTSSPLYQAIKFFDACTEYNYK